MARYRSANFCYKCGARRLAEARFCNNCGMGLTPLRPKHCKKCGARISGEARFCHGCGTEISSMVPPKYLYLKILGAGFLVFCLLWCLVNVPGFPGLFVFVIFLVLSFLSFGDFGVCLPRSADTRSQRGGISR